MLRPRSVIAVWLSVLLCCVVLLWSVRRIGRCCVCCALCNSLSRHWRLREDHSSSHLATSHSPLYRLLPFFVYGNRVIYAIYVGYYTPSPLLSVIPETPLSPERGQQTGDALSDIQTECQRGVERCPAACDGDSGDEFHDAQVEGSDAEVGQATAGGAAIFVCAGIARKTGRLLSMEQLTQDEASANEGAAMSEGSGMEVDEMEATVAPSTRR